MKSKFLAVALTCVTGTAFAAPEIGVVNFNGSVYAGGPCPIEVVNPGGGIGTPVQLGHFPSTYFDAVGATSKKMEFTLKVTPTPGVCVINPGTEVSVAFDSRGGATGPKSDLYKLSSGGTPDLGIAIFDADDKKLAPLDDSRKYPLFENIPTHMAFYAQYEAIKVPVTEGAAQADVGFTVALP
ncbi:fimbrial protein [Pseudomonas sp. S32]|uniref:fimbrial protein n=1 Tax=Pseudomonas sp. S32 TaxID=2767448 RepID=UPI0019125188|nr:fimbrial protein [Pseudomonas sp. S32]MBK5007169.1 type 1 fimbrial protein [Pseudomonas sp. S32]